MFKSFFKAFSHKEKTSPVRVFLSDRPKIKQLQKDIARELDLVGVSQAQVIRYLLKNNQQHP